MCWTWQGDGSTGAGALATFLQLFPTHLPLVLGRTWIKNERNMFRRTFLGRIMVVLSYLRVPNLEIFVAEHGMQAMSEASTPGADSTASRPSIHSFNSFETLRGWDRQKEVGTGVQTCSLFFPSMFWWHETWGDEEKVVQPQVALCMPFWLFSCACIKLLSLQSSNEFIPWLGNDLLIVYKPGQAL